MSKEVTMDTICSSYVDASLAGSGRNTIRKYQGVYPKLRVGDRVTMNYRAAEGVTQFATEKLEVASIAIGTLDKILEEHDYANHGYSKNVNLFQLFEDIYGDTEGLFCAIYFK